MFDNVWEMLMDSGFTMPVCTTGFYSEKTGLKYKIIAVKSKSSKTTHKNIVF